jgi:hypothetical protein
MDREFSCGRYIGPFSKVEVEELLSPFQSSPLSLVPKPGKTDKYRAVHNFSFPHSPQDNISSINYSIDSNLFPCIWGTFVMLCAIIWHLSEGSQASICDVTEAYCTIPILPAQWPGLIVKLRKPDQFAINTNDNFSLTSAGGIHGSVADAGTDLFHAVGIGPLSKWLMTIFSSKYCMNISQHTMKSIRNGTDTSSQMVADYKMAADTGFKGKPCQMGVSWSLMKIPVCHSKTSQQPHLALSMRHVSPITTQTLITYQISWAFHGRT